MTVSRACCRTDFLVSNASPRRSRTRSAWLFAVRAVASSSISPPLPVSTQGPDLICRLPFSRQQSSASIRKFSRNGEASATGSIPPFSCSAGQRSPSQAGVSPNKRNTPAASRAKRVSPSASSTASAGDPVFGISLGGLNHSARQIGKGFFHSSAVFRACLDDFKMVRAQRSDACLVHLPLWSEIELVQRENKR